MLNEPLEGDGIIAFSYGKSPYNLWDKGSHEGQDSSTASTRLRALPFSSYSLFPFCLEPFSFSFFHLVYSILIKHGLKKANKLFYFCKAKQGVSHPQTWLSDTLKP